MPVVFETTVQESSGQLRVNLPQEVVAALKIKKGDVLLISLDDHHIVMEKAKP